MRLSSRDVTFTVTAAARERPIRMRGGGMTFWLCEAEAIDLANQLADAVDELNTHERKPPP